MNIITAIKYWLDKILDFNKNNFIIIGSNKMYNGIFARVYAFLNIYHDFFNMSTHKLFNFTSEINDSDNHNGQKHNSH